MMFQYSAPEISYTLIIPQALDSVLIQYNCSVIVLLIVTYFEREGAYCWLWCDIAHLFNIYNKI
jgi:hypothetical protein